MNIGDRLIGVGLDRIDYTKGVVERINAIDRLLELFPEYRTRLVFLQLGSASRLGIDSYRDVIDEIDSLIYKVNGKYGHADWKPIIRIPDNPDPAVRMATRVMADFYVVSSLHDGMNLVAKEYVSSRYDEDGTLILSPFHRRRGRVKGRLLGQPVCHRPLCQDHRRCFEDPVHREAAPHEEDALRGAGKQYLQVGGGPDHGNGRV